MEEEAKAVQEVAKTTGKAIDASVRVGSFLSKIFGDAFAEIGEAFHDWAKYYRLKNLLKIQNKVEEIHKKRKIEGKTMPISLRYAFPIIQNASQEDDELLQEMWAGLIANATDPNKRIDAKKIYIDILSSLEPFDVQVMLFVSRQGWKLFREVPEGGIGVKTLMEYVSAGEMEIQLSLQNLARLGCIVDEFSETWDSLGSSSFGARVDKPMTTFKLSPLGFDLLAACEH